MRAFDRTLGLVIATQDDKLWFQAVRFVILAWVWLFIIMWLGYLTLAFFGQLPTLPTHQVPEVPLIPPFNQSEFLGELGEIGAMTTQAIPLQ